MHSHCHFLVANSSFEGGGELEIVESFLDDDEGLEAVACFLGGELGPERRVAPLEVQDPDGLGVAVMIHSSHALVHTFLMQRVRDGPLCVLERYLTP